MRMHSTTMFLGSALLGCAVMKAMSAGPPDIAMRTIDHGDGTLRFDHGFAMARDAHSDGSGTGPTTDHTALGDDSAMLGSGHDDGSGSPAAMTARKQHLSDTDGELEQHGLASGHHMLA